MGGVMHLWGQETHRISLYFPFNFATNLNCSKKYIIIIIIIKLTSKVIWGVFASLYALL